MIDLHTHLYPESDSRYLTGFDELLNYHYVLGEFYKTSGKLKKDIQIFNLKSKQEKSEEIWDTLFKNIRPSKYNSEHVNGILTCINEFAFDGDNIDLTYTYNHMTYHQIHSSYKSPSLKNILNRSGLSSVVATYSPDDKIEDNKLIIPSIRLDNTYLSYTKINSKALYYSFSCESSELLSFNTLNDSLLYDLKESEIPFWIMLGVKRNVTPYMGLGGDSIGECDISKLIKFANLHPELKIPFSILDSSKIHEAIVASRVTPNLYFSGHWWFNNIPSMIKQTTKMAVDLIGYDNFIHYYSDARVADQLYYKWKHFNQYQKELGYELHTSNGRLWETLFGVR